MATPASRDPFAKPGEVGNRWISFGNDGQIPAAYMANVKAAIEIAYRLKDKPQFPTIFTDTVSKLSGQSLTAWAYIEALDKMVINLAETSRNPKIKKELADDAEAHRRDSNYKSPGALSLVNGKDVWLREFLLRQGQKAIVGALIHEAAHLVGAPTNPLAEIALDRIHNAAGYGR
jgi:hypothetical protein